MLLLCPLMHTERRPISKPGHPFRGVGFPISRRQHARAIQTNSPANTKCLWLSHVTLSNESPENLLLAEERCKKYAMEVCEITDFQQPQHQGKNKHTHVIGWQRLDSALWASISIFSTDKLGHIIPLLCSLVYSLAAHGDTQLQKYGTGCS